MTQIEFEESVIKPIGYTTFFVFLVGAVAGATFIVIFTISNIYNTGKAWSTAAWDYLHRESYVEAHFDQRNTGITIKDSVFSNNDTGVTVKSETENGLNKTEADIPALTDQAVTTTNADGGKEITQPAVEDLSVSGPQGVIDAAKLFAGSLLDPALEHTYSFSKNCFTGVKEIRDKENSIDIEMNKKEGC